MDGQIFNQILYDCHRDENIYAHIMFAGKISD